MAVTVRNIFLFVPNLIGYGRIVLAFISFYFMRTNYVLATSCYLMSVMLDEFDGRAARMLNQESRFGAMLDLLTDRAATACLVVTLATLYPDYTFWLQLSMALDIVGHWMHSHASLLTGEDSHKNIGVDGNPIMRIYYIPWVLTVMCYGNELFFSMLYLLHFTEGPLVPLLNIGLVRVFLYTSLPVMVAKTFVTLIHLVDGSRQLASVDVQERTK